MTSSEMNSDLQKERRRCNFDTEELTNLLDCGANNTAKRRAQEETILSLKELKDDVPEEYLSHKEKYENSIRKAIIFRKVLSYGSANFMQQIFEKRDKSAFRRILSTAIFQDGSPFLLHTGMFLPAKLVQADEEQKKYWYTRARNMEIIGTYAQDGTFISSPNSKLTYGTTMFVRIAIVNTSATYLSRAVTIAVRYSAVRHQSQRKPKDPEPQILDNVTQQHKLFFAIATSYAYIFVSYRLADLYFVYAEQTLESKYDSLPELHALSCVLKALSSSDCTALINGCRLACGGHGFMMSSKLPQIYEQATAGCTYEGENTVLLLQTAMSLMKVWKEVALGQPLSPSMAYLSDKTLELEWDGSRDSIVRAFQIVSQWHLV